MKDFIFRLYSLIHLTAKRLLGYHVDASLNLKPSAVELGIGFRGEQEWKEFIRRSIVNNDSIFEGLYYAGYILEKKKWCHNSWIWTNAAIVRLYCELGMHDEAIAIADRLIERQLPCGGWIVRHDYDSKGAIPMLAPNDSAYIANNAMLSVYNATGVKHYLESACHCAQWIMDTCRADGMIFTGYNTRDDVWNKSNIIVDVGFTGGLFANLYAITKDTKYKNFLTTFAKRYIKLFYLPSAKGFTTSINKFDKPQGGMFARGQAWALEGLIPAYRILNNKTIRQTIESTIENLLEHQNKDGSWPYNLTRKLMGNDCKGVAVIAKSLMEWHAISNDSRLLEASKKALKWCRQHTATSEEARGGIFSFCTEGAIVTDLYTSCAFVYSSVYAIEIEHLLNNGDI